MAYYYWKTGGTAVGDAGRYASQQTGSFATLGAANYYASLTAALAATTSPVAGDFGNGSDLSSNTAAGALTITGIAPAQFYIMSVDDANIENARASGNRAVENSSVSGDVVYSDVFISGLEIAGGDDQLFSGSNVLQDTKLISTGSSDRIISVTSDGASLTAINCEFAINHISSFMFISSGSLVNIIGGSVTTTTAGVTSLFSAGFVGGGGELNFYGVDLSAVTGTLIANVGSVVGTDDAIDVKFDMCKLASGVAFTNELFRSKNQRALFTRCSDSSAAAEYQYHLHAFGGDVDDDSAIFRNEDEAFTESNQKISYKIVTNSDASLGSPLWFDFPVLRYSRLSAGATDTLRFYITSNTALTDKDIYIEISYPDGTNKQTPNFLSSAPTTVGGTLDLMAAGTTLTTDAASTWTGALSNLYQIDVDTSGDVGADCQPIVKVYVTLPSVTIQIASEYGLS